MRLLGYLRLTRHSRGRQRRRSVSPRINRAARLSFVTMEDRLLPTVTIAIDYSFDTNNFFNTQAKKDILQLAASTLGASLNQTLSPIAAGGSNTWTAQFPNPSTGSTQNIQNLNVPSNTIIIYVGGTQLGSTSEAGEGSTGGFNGTGDSNWINLLKSRGQAGALTSPPTVYAPWGGAISFDNTGATNWYFGQDPSGISTSQTDFLSVAEHEIGHVLGLGTSNVWTSQLVGNNFTGASSEAANGGNPITVSSGKNHWAQGTTSNGQLACMDPTLLNGTRDLFTPLDYAGLDDLGWQVRAVPPTVQFNASTTSVRDNTGSAQITVTRSGDLAAFNVSYATSDGTAVAGTNYTSKSGVLKFTAGVTTQTITVPITAANASGINLNFNVSLTNPTSGAVLGGSSTTVVTLVNSQNEVIGDFDGDGRTDMGVFRPTTTQFIIRQTTAGTLTPFPTLGAANLIDTPIVGDFDHVGHAQVAVFRPLTAQWFVLGPNGGHLLGVFGAQGGIDIPVPGDYLGLGYTQMAVYRPSTGQWFVNSPTGGKLLGNFGQAGLVDIPAPGDYLGLGYTQMAVFRPSTAQWFVNSPTGGKLLGVFGASGLVDIPVPGDYDGLGHTQMAVFRPSTAQWFANGANGGHLIGSMGVTNYFDLPIEGSAGSLIALGVIRSPGIPPYGSNNPGSGFSSRAVSSGPLVIEPTVANATSHPSHRRHHAR